MNLHSFDPCELSVANLGKGDSIIIKLGGSKKEIKIALGTMPPCNHLTM